MGDNGSSVYGGSVGGGCDAIGREKMDGLENYTQEINGQISCSLGYELYRK